MLPTLRLTLVFVLATASGACAQQPAPAPQPVWVNLSSGVYHCPGTEHYGSTRNGEYLPETAAIDSGYRANGGRYCSAALAAQYDGTLGVIAPPPVPLPDAGPPTPTTGLTACVVSKIRDGDTIECRDGGAVRLIGIDSPERDQAPFGAMATDGLLALISLRDTIQLSSDKEARDQYGRLLGYLWRDGVSVNFLMIRQGWAVALEYYPNTSYAEWFRAAEALAERQKRGLWEVNGFQCRPSKHRAGLC
jgi:endonuclease YncB( thermonuclease family)